MSETEPVPDVPPVVPPDVTVSDVPPPPPTALDLVLGKLEELRLLLVEIEKNTKLQPPPP